MRSTILKSVAVTSFLIFTACGSTVANQSITGGASSLIGGVQATPTSTPSSGNIYNLPDATTYTAKINGIGGAVPTYVSPAIATSRTLRVKISPLSAPNMTLPGYTGWVFPYGCMQLQVTVNGVTQTTNVLKVANAPAAYNSVCANNPSSEVLDFSNDITGNGTVNVTISNAVYDNCRSWGNAFNYGCAMSAMFMNHVAAATVQIQGDGTYLANY